MTEQNQQQESQKTVVAFVAGLLIGGLLVWVFSSAPATEPEVGEVVLTETSESTDVEEAPVTDETATEEDTTPAMQVGEGTIVVADQPAGLTVSLDSATFPTDEGWVAVRTYPNGQLGSVLGAARYSKEQDLAPDTIALLAPTTAGRTYAVVFFSEDGNRQFNLAGDAQIDGVLSTFVAQ